MISMRDIPRMTAFELLNQEIHGDLRELRPLVRIDDPPTERILPLDLPLITLTDETAPDGDISLGSHAVHEDRETLLERILPVVRANPQPQLYSHSYYVLPKVSRSNTRCSQSRTPIPFCNRVMSFAPG